MGTRLSRRQRARARRRQRLLSVALGLGLASAGSLYLASGHRFSSYLDAAASAAGVRTTQTAVIRASARPASASPASASPATASPSPVTGQPGARASIPPASVLDSAVQQVLTMINQVRVQDELPPYTLSTDLTSSATAHDLAMARGCGLSHQCPGESPLGERESAAGVHWTAAGENIGEGGPEPATAQAMTQLVLTLTQDMLSEHPPADGHRRNLLSSAFHRIGIAVVRDSNGTIWLTQDFAS